MWRHAVRAAVRLGMSNEKSPRRMNGAGSSNSCDDVTLPVICPTCQTLMKIQQSIFAKLKPEFANIRREMKMPANDLSVRAVHVLR
jgi:hypothetical protein